MRTWNAKANEVERKWWIVDASGKTLGRLASEVAKLIRGKHKTTFTPHVDTGDFVIVLNSDKVEMTGAKWEEKTYFWHNHYFGSLKQITAQELREKKPEDLVRNAVQGMLPKTKLGRAQIKKLKVFAGGEHPHAAQKPQAYNV